MAAHRAQASFQRVNADAERTWRSEGSAESDAEAERSPEAPAFWPGRPRFRTWRSEGSAESDAEAERSPEAPAFWPGRPRFRTWRSEGSAECDDVTGLLGDARSVCVKRTRS